MRETDRRLARYALALVWLVTGVLSLGIYPQQQSLQLLGRVGLSGDFALFTLLGSSMLDVMLGILTITHPSRFLWRTQSILVLIYSVIIACFLPEYWLHPFGPMLKNLPVLVLLWLLNKYEEKVI